MVQSKCCSSALGIQDAVMNSRVVQRLSYATRLGQPPCLSEQAVHIHLSTILWYTCPLFMETWPKSVQTENLALTPVTYQTQNSPSQAPQPVPRVREQLGKVSLSLSFGVLSFLVTKMFVPLLCSVVSSESSQWGVLYSSRLGGVMGWENMWPTDFPYQMNQTFTFPSSQRIQV